jgi:hypothetical protein
MFHCSFLRLPFVIAKVVVNKCECQAETGNRKSTSITSEICTVAFKSIPLRATLFLTSDPIDVTHIIKVNHLKVLVFKLLAAALQYFSAFLHYPHPVGDLLDAEDVVC